MLGIVMPVMVAFTVNHARAQTDDDALRITAQAEARRIATIERVSASVVCIFDKQRRGGGSGVIIDAEGYGLTNFHVLAAMLDTRSGFGGLSDGKLYELEVLGVDPGGDVAMFRLLGRDEFSFVLLGDSDAVRLGDPAIAMGNPFVLAEDYTPTVTLGIVTGVHRYQWGQGRQLVYSDCIQVDAPINPGNSGGPLFNAAGELIGINGRISVNARGRFNVGVGYAISTNQIKRFMPGMRAGLLVEHGTLQATVDDIEDRGVLFDSLLEDAPAWNAGIRPGDRLLRFAGHTIRSRNHFASVLGTYPAGWPTTIEYERDGRRREVTTRLEPLSSKLRAPFEVSRRVNLRAVKRVLNRFVDATRAPGDPTADPSSRKWQITREQLTEGQIRTGSASARPKPSVRYEIVWTRGQPSRSKRRYEDGRAGRVIEYDDKTAVQRQAGGDGRFELPVTRRLALQALHTLETQIFDACRGTEWTQLRHAGADALVVRRGGQAGAPSFDSDRRVGDGSWSDTGVGRRVEDQRMSSVPHPSLRDEWGTLLEVIEHPLSEHVVARFGHDARDFRVRRIMVTDTPTGMQVTIDLRDYRDVGGVMFPCTIEVRSAAFAYRDTLTDWEAVP